MAFLVIFNEDGAPVDDDLRGLWPACAGRVERASAGAPQLAMFLSNPAEAGDAGRARHEQAGKDDAHDASLHGLELIGRIRLDRRDDIRAALGAPASASDAALCLRAYGRWGDDCVDHLRGDFCFVLWDAPRRRLFCARDQLGVRPLFHAQANGRWVIGDSLDVVARASRLTNELDDAWIADFLLEPFCQDFERTVYSHVKRLPQAHLLIASRDGGAIRRYWSLEIETPLFLQRPQEYLDRFHETLARAVRDRLPPGTVGVTMSGGLDSTTLAAKAVEVAGDAARVVAFTSHYERLIQDDEARFSALVAARLGLSQKFAAMDHICELHAEAPHLPTAEPGGPTAKAPARQAIETDMARQTTVWLFGEGPDNALTFEWLSYLRWLAGQGDWRRFAGAVGRYIRDKPPRDWMRVLEAPGRLARRIDGAPPNDPPPWIDADFARRAGLAERRTQRLATASHPWRPAAMRSFASPVWQRLFEHIDPVIAGSALDYRHPYLDLDVLTFMLATPPIPWARRKRLIRDAMRGRLPDEILARDKTPLAVDPLAVAARAATPRPLSANAALSRYVDAARLQIDDAAPPAVQSLEKVRLLDAWLRDRPR
ncbi:MAG: hypothetical protein EKK29_01450 [Hyphomicrobiales bacterium]|nr:MAG: hypothetical protein EKK29_01450 [Hyphomicrobiales bacterium]